MTGLQFSGSVINPQNPYIVNPALVEAVSFALYLRRPLLLEGEPGCGKTQLAYAVAHELQCDFSRWDVSYRSQAKDGLYNFDAAARLFDAQLAAHAPDLEKYVTFGPIGRAFRAQQAIVLIDEIDKAEQHFPPELWPLLTAPWEFYIPELNAFMQALNPPLFIITNNQTTDNLSESFIRRCIYHYIEFPDDRELFQITHHHILSWGQQPYDRFIRRVLHEFIGIRKQHHLRYRPGISDLLDWIKLLLHHNHGQSSLDSLLDEEVLPYTHIFKRTRLSQEAESNVPSLLDVAPHNRELSLGVEPPPPQPIAPDYSDHNVLIKLRLLLVEKFDEEEMRTLCFDTDINYDTIGGRDHASKARELIAYFQRRDRVPSLIEAIQLSRPDIDLAGLFGKH